MKRGNFWQHFGFRGIFKFYTNKFQKKKISSTLSFPSGSLSSPPTKDSKEKTFAPTFDGSSLSGLTLSLSLYRRRKKKRRMSSLEEKLTAIGHGLGG